MRNLILTVATASLVALSPARGWARSPQAHSFLDTRQQVARNFETKGDVARAKQEYGSAETWYRAALANDRKNAVLENKLGLVQLKQGEMQDARNSFTQAVRHNSTYVDALNNLGAVDCLDRRYKPAVRYLKEALALDEGRAVSHLNLAEAWMGQKQTERAMAEYTRALELDADILDSAANDGFNAQITNLAQRAVVDFLIARAYAKRGNKDGALDYLRMAKQAHYRDLASVYTEPEFAFLWKDPRLAEIVKR
jgi:tetratricopeptide (TPR) repeat protein